MLFRSGLMAFTPKSIASTLPIKSNLVTLASCDDDAIKIKITFTFGKKSKDCDGRGLCSIEIEVGLVAAGSNTGTAGLEDGQLVVDFDKKSMDKGAIATQFAGNQFVVEEDYTIDNKQLGQYTIVAGTYEVKDLGGTLRVIF